MYKIKLLDEDNATGVRKLIANNHDELRAVVTLATEAGYFIVSVQYIEPLQTAQEFLEEIKDQIKPKQPEDLVYGKGGYNFKINVTENEDDKEDSK